MELFAIRVFTPRGEMKWFVEGWLGDRGPDVLTLDREKGVFFTNEDVAKRTAEAVLGSGYSWEVVRLSVATSR